MVAEKMHARGIGPKVSLTRQPTAGRRKGGGLRIGEMERDSVLSHGISSFMQESMMERSDKYSWVISKKSGVIYPFNPSIKNRVHKENEELVQVNTPYSFKLLVQELEAMGIQVRLNTDKKVQFPELDFEDINESSDEEYEDNDNTMTGGGNWFNMFFKTHPDEEEDNNIDNEPNKHDNEKSDDETGDDETGDDETGDDETGDDETSDDETSDDETSDDEEKDKEPNKNDDVINNDVTSDDETSDDEITGDETSDQELSDDELSDDELSDDESIEDKGINNPIFGGDLSEEIKVINLK